MWGSLPISTPRRMGHPSTKGYRHSKNHQEIVLNEQHHCSEREFILSEALRVGLAFIALLARRNNHHLPQSQQAPLSARKETICCHNNTACLQFRRLFFAVVRIFCYCNKAFLLFVSIKRWIRKFIILFGRPILLRHMEQTKFATTIIPFSFFILL